MITPEEVKEKGRRREDLEKDNRKIEVWEWGEYLYLLKNYEIKAAITHTSPAYRVNQEIEARS